MKPRGNGLVELVDERSDDRGFFCMKLLSYINDEVPMGTEAYGEVYERRIAEAKAGACAYAERCPNHARTMTKLAERYPLFKNLKY